MKGMVLAGANGGWGVGGLLPGTWGPWPTLGVQVVAGATFFWLLLHLLGIRAYRELLELAGELVRGERPPPVAPPPR